MDGIVKEEILYIEHFRKEKKNRDKISSRNAIKILDILYYQKELVDSVENRAEDFMVENKWRDI